MGVETLVALYMLTVQLGWMIVPLAACVTALGFATVVPLARAYARKMDAEAKSPPLPADIFHRLERMERALDFVTLEIERSRLLAEDQYPPDKPQISSGDKSAQDQDK
jgi:hypothetical protein